MASDRVTSISAKQLAPEVRKAVDAATAKHKLQGVKIDGGVALIPPSLIGFILRDADLQQKTLSDLQALAADVAKPLKGAMPATYIHDGHIIIGFVAESAITLLRE